MIRYQEFRQRGWQIGSGPTESQCRLCTKWLKGYGRVGTGPTPRPLPPWIPWIETANGVRSGQTPATPRLKVAQNAGHTQKSALR